MLNVKDSCLRMREKRLMLKSWLMPAEVRMLEIFKVQRYT